MFFPPHANSPLRTAAPLFAVLVCAGCGGGEAVDLEKEFESLQFREKLVETPLGSFAIPVPMINSDAQSGDLLTNRVQLTFTLHALVPPEHEAETNRIVERHTGRIRDRVIKVCRNATVDDLLDPQLATLRSRLLDAAQPLFEGVTLRRMLITDMMSESL